MLSKEKTLMKMAVQMAAMSKCCSHQVCSLIVKNGRIISTGINGTFSGRINCCEHAKNQGWLNEDNTLNQEFRQDHSNWSLINEIHAELNAIQNAAKLGICLDNSEMYCTLAPCINCAKSIASAGIVKLFYYKEYDNINHKSDDWKQILEESGVEVVKLTLLDE